MSFIRKNNNLKKKLAIVVLLSLSLSLPCLLDVKASSIALSNQTKQDENTTKPHNLTFKNIPTPSEFSSKNTKSNTNDFVIQQNANSFFSPVETVEQPTFDNTLNVIVEDKVVEEPAVEIAEEKEIVQETPTIIAEEKLPDIVENTEIKEIELENPNFYLTDVQEETNLEGKTISGVKIAGIQSFDKDKILNVLNSKVGSSFNEQLVQNDLQKFYDSGYFSENMSAEPTLNKDGTVSLEFTVQENVIVSDIKLIGNNVVSTEELVPHYWKMKGAPQNLGEINKALDNIIATYHEKGYVLANIASVNDTSEGVLNIEINEGVIDNINISGNEQTKDFVITRNIMTEVGSVYNEEYLKKDLARIFSTQIFEEVNREITPSANNNGHYDVTVVVKEKVNNSIAFGGGIDTGLGAFGSVSLRDDNFLGKAQKVSLSGILGSGILLSDSSIKNHMNYHVELGFVEPHFLNADNSLMSKIYYREMGSFQVPLAIERRIGANVGIEHKIHGNDNLKADFLLGAEHVNLKEGDFNRISKLYDKYNLDIRDRARQLNDGFFIHLSPGIKFNNLDTDENPRNGIIAQARFTESLGVSNFNHTTGRLAGSVTKFFPVLKKSSFSLTAKAGARIHGDDMPEFMAYRLGGPYTIRGYRMNGVGSGESFLMGSAELATPLPWSDRLKWDFVKRMRLTFFVDAGKVFDPTITSTLYDRPLHAITAGIGLRMYIPGVGPISVDYGIPITNPGSNGSEHGYFTFGTGGLNGLYGWGY